MTGEPFSSLSSQSRWRLGEAYGWIEYGMRGSSLEHRRACGLLAVKWLTKALA